MALVEIKRDVSASDLQSFGRIWFPAFCVLLGALVHYRWHMETLSGVLFGVAIASFVFSYFSPQAIRPIYWGLMYLTFPIGFVVSHVLVGVIYFLVVTPIGWLIRLIKGDPLHRSLDRTAASYWLARPEEIPTARYFRQF